MTLVLEESEDISPEILSPILATLKRNNEVSFLCILYEYFFSCVLLAADRSSLTGCYANCKKIGRDGYSELGGQD